MIFFLEWRHNRSLKMKSIRRFWLSCYNAKTINIALTAKQNLQDGPVGIQVNPRVLPSDALVVYKLSPNDQPKQRSSSRSNLKVKYQAQFTEKLNWVFDLELDRYFGWSLELNLYTTDFSQHRTDRFRSSDPRSEGPVRYFSNFSVRKSYLK